MVSTKDTLMRAYGWWGYTVVAVILAALALQVTALCVPFMQISKFLDGTTTYGLLKSVNLMWQGQLYVIAILIVSFSVVFPFLKLSGLLVAWMILPASATRTKLIRLLGLLGKWSMMDPFCVVLLIAIATDQWAVGADTELGIYLFLCAVALSMTLSLIMLHCDRATRTPAPAGNAGAFPLAAKSGLAGAVVPFSLLISIVALYFALRIPFLQVDQFLLASTSFGVFDVCVELWTHNHRALATLAWIGLVIVPAVTILLECWAWIWPATVTQHITRRRFVDGIYEWSMLDVFSLALVLFLLEGANFIKTEVHQGLWFIVSAVIISQLCRRIARHTAQKCFRRRLD